MTCLIIGVLLQQARSRYLKDPLERAAVSGSEWISQDAILYVDAFKCSHEDNMDCSPTEPQKEKQIFCRRRRCLDDWAFEKATLVGPLQVWAGVNEAVALQAPK